MLSVIRRLKRFHSSQSLAARLTAIVGTLMLSMLLSQAYGIISVRTLSEAVKRSSSTSGLEFLGEASMHSVEISQTAWAASAVYSPGQPVKENLIKDINSSVEALDQRILKFKAEVQPEGKSAELVQTLQETILSTKISVRKLSEKLTNAVADRSEISGDCSALSDSLLGISDSVSELMGLEKKKGSDTEAIANETSKRNIIVGSIMLVISLIAGVFSILMAQRTSTEIRKISHELANQSTIVVGQSISLNRTATNLSANVDSSSAALVETSASLEEVKSMVVSNQNNCDKSLIAAQENQKKVQEGVRAMEKLSHALQELSISVEENESGVQSSYTEIAKISEMIREIDSKTSIINSIVFQTKLLSFNASVEAARAGDHGRGFAVVAEEVGNLAAMSGKAAKEISELLRRSTAQVQSLIHSSQENVAKLNEKTKNNVEVCMDVAQSSASIFGEITQRVVSLNEMVSNVATASREQTTGIEQIAEALQSLEVSTHSNADDARKSKEVGDSMRKAAGSLSTSVTKLRIIVAGSGVAKIGQKFSRSEDPAVPKAVIEKSDSEIDEGDDDSNLTAA